MLTGLGEPDAAVLDAQGAPEDAADGGMIKATQRHEILADTIPLGVSSTNNPEVPHHQRRDHQSDPSRRPGTLGTAVARLPPLLPGRAHPGGHRANLGALYDPNSGVHGLVAEQHDQLAGLAHLVLHPTTWATHPTCYLEDLYVAGRGAGQDIAHKLIEAVYAFADGSAPPASTGSRRNTTPQHAPIRHLAHRTSFVVYRR